MVLGVYVLALSVSPLARLITGGIAGGDRNRQLDGMRALAAVGVVACHINQYMMAFIGYSAPPLWGNHVGILGVQLFFALTAFLFTSKALDGRFHPRQFCIDRMRRILPLYFAVCIAAFGIASYYSWHQSYPVDRMILDAIDVLSHGFWQKDAIQFRDINMLTLVGIAWTLSYEWAFYLLLIPAFYLWRTGRTAKFAVVSLITILAVRDFYLHPEQVIWPFFLPGIAAAFMRNRVPRPAASALNLMAIPAVFLVLWLPTFWTPIKLLLVSLIFFAVLFGRPAWLTWAPLQTLGLISYSIYLVQYLVLYPVVQTIFATPALAGNRGPAGNGRLRRSGDDHPCCHHLQVHRAAMGEEAQITTRRNETGRQRGQPAGGFRGSSRCRRPGLDLRLSLARRPHAEPGIADLMIVHRGIVDRHLEAEHLR